MRNIFGQVFKQCIRFFRISNRCKSLSLQLLPNNPLGTNDCEKLEVILLCAPKDERFLELCIKGLELNCMNEITSFTIISPKPLEREIFSNKPLIYKQDESFISNNLLDFIRSSCPEKSWNILKKQLIMFNYAVHAASNYQLYFDVDTILLSKTNFINKAGVQVLHPVTWWEESYSKSAVNAFGIACNALNLTFVSHYQLWSKIIIKGLFSLNNNSVEQSLLLWLGSNEITTWNEPSEFHTYGTYATNIFPKKVMLARWGNIRCSHNTLPTEFETFDTCHRYEYIKEISNGANSISFHHYLPDFFFGN